MQRSFSRFVPALATLSLVAGTVGYLYQAEAASSASAQQSVERGRYLVKIGGCNDCHTAGYAQAGGEVPESEWLKGDRLGWRGPWGTTYAPNLRLTLAGLSEDQWVQFAHNAKLRPPMPWFNLHAMSERDLRDMHRYVRALGPAGEPAPAYVPPTAEPQGPVVTFPAPPK